MNNGAVERWTYRPRGQKCRPLLELLRQIDRHVQCERTFEWLFLPKVDERSDLESTISAALVAHCRSTRQRHSVKAECEPQSLLADPTITGRTRRLELDFFLPALDTGIEFDERQHFTEERRVTLEQYGDLNVGFDTLRWRNLCSPRINDPDPPCRDWERAFRDTVRDIRSPRHGVRLIRIYYKDFDQAACSMPSAIDRLRSLFS